LDAAQRHGRKVAFVGRSMVRNMGIARELGYLTIPDGLVVKDLKALDRLRPDQMTIIATGSQGEPMAALARMANRDHPVSIIEGDTVLMASSLIPGNENAIYRVINELTRLGANVVHKGNAKVHVSGHASAGELAYCYNIIRPSNVLPVHGEWRHLRANADIAIRTGVDPQRVLIAQDGSVIDLVDGRPRITGTVPAGLVYVDAMTVGGTTEETLHVRRTLAEEGVVTIVCIIDPDTGRLTEDPDYLAHGFPPEVMDFSAATPAIQTALTKAAKDGIEDLDQIEDLVRRAASNWAHRTHRRSPLIIPVIVDA
jgi:ribonuclease J